MDAYNMNLLKGDMKECANQLKWQWGIKREDAGKCIACKKCEEVCTQHLPIIERLDEIAKMTEEAS
jgi:predicted aldo/keto reductase-like oxidoreductase